MKRNKSGISLIVLVITIIVMIILAAAVIIALDNSGIISRANEAVGETNLDQVQHAASLIWADAYLEHKDIADEETRTAAIKEDVIKALEAQGITKANYKIVVTNNGVTVTAKVGGNDPVGDATVNVKTDENSTIDGKPYSATNPIIPKGFMPIDTATSTWDEENIAANVKNGLVISDGTSEFVWIPVEDITEMAKANVTDGVTNYEGVLYDFEYYDENLNMFTYDVAQEKTNYGQGTENNREPANLTRSGYEDKADRFTAIRWNENFYQESFNKMVESVAKYKGFYVGRYEMSIGANGKAQSKAGATSVYNNSDANNWWGLYEKALTYSSSGVVSEMIWGCQYDAMMRWMQGNNIDVTSRTPTDTAREKNATYNNTRVTGSADSNDILNNVYDILGNSYEWTQEAYRIDTHAGRGGDSGYERDCHPSHRAYFFPTVTYGYYGSRLTLYVELD